jgi:hypothetical protein
MLLYPAGLGGHQSACTVAQGNEAERRRGGGTPSESFQQLQLADGEELVGDLHEHLHREVGVGVGRAEGLREPPLKVLDVGPEPVLLDELEVVEAALRELVVEPAARRVLVTAGGTRGSPTGGYSPRLTGAEVSDIVMSQYVKCIHWHAHSQVVVNTGGGGV